MPLVRTPESSQTWQDAQRTSALSVSCLPANVFRKLWQSLLSPPCQPWANSTSAASAQWRQQSTGVRQITGLAYNTVVSIVRAASQRAQLVHNAKVQAIETTEVSADELWSFVSKNKRNALMALCDNKRENGIDGRTRQGKVWEQTKITARLVVSYFNWVWQHSRFKNTAAQRAGLTTRSWSWHDILTYPTIIWCTTAISDQE